MNIMSWPLHAGVNPANQGAPRGEGATTADARESEVPSDICIVTASRASNVVSIKVDAHSASESLFNF
jgi:hypothetical protein